MPSPAPISGRCGARVKAKPELGREGGYCTQPRMRDQTRCRFHGGAAPHNKAAAERRGAEREARSLVAKYGLPVAIDPADALLDSLHSTYGAVLALRDAVMELEPQALVWGPSEIVEVNATQFPGVDRTEKAHITPLVELYERNLDRLAKIATDAVKVGISLRQEQRAAQMGEFLLDAMLRFAVLVGADSTSPATIAAANEALQAAGRAQPAPLPRALPR